MEYVLSHRHSIDRNKRFLSLLFSETPPSARTLRPRQPLVMVMLLWIGTRFSDFGLPDEDTLLDHLS